MTNNRQGINPTVNSSVSDSAAGEVTAKSMTLADWLARSSLRLSASNSELALSNAVAYARLLAAKILGFPKARLMAHPEMYITPGQLADLEASLERLLAGEALPYVLGEWEFYGHRFTVSPQTLIPRPETELIIGCVLSWAKGHGIRRVVDVGTGSVCIAVTLALALPDAHITATDISQTALQVAQSNMFRYGVQRQVDLVQGDLLGAFAPSSFDVICANLPYIPSERLSHLAVAQREPRLALDGGPDGLDLIARLIPQAARLLIPGGLALLEIDDTHTEAVLELAGQAFPGRAQVLNDYQGKPRLLRLEKCGEQG